MNPLGTRANGLKSGNKGTISRRQPQERKLVAEEKQGLPPRQKPQQPAHAPSHAHRRSRPRRIPGGSCVDPAKRTPAPTGVRGQEQPEQPWQGTALESSRCPGQTRREDTVRAQGGTETDDGSEGRDRAPRNKPSHLRSARGQTFSGRNRLFNKRARTPGRPRDGKRRGSRHIQELTQNGSQT